MSEFKCTKRIISELSAHLNNDKIALHQQRLLVEAGNPNPPLGVERVSSVEAG